MACLINKRKKGRLYVYWVESARVNGKPRIVQQVYLGPRDRFLQEIKQAYTRGKTPGPSPLKRLRVKEFGASAWLWHWAEQLQLAQIVDRHVPGSKRKRRTPLSVGQYLVIAAINRAIRASSKRSLYLHWYQDSVLSRLLPAKATQLSSQRFWDHMDPIEQTHIEAIQQELLERLQQLFAVGEETLLYDTTNYFSFIDTFNQRSKLAQRGHNKQKRYDLRQLSLALFTDQDSGLPLYHQCYAGQQPDVSHFNEAWQGMVQSWTAGVRRRPRQLTLVFDAGNSSKKNLSGLEEDHLHYVGSIPGRWMPELLEIPLQQYRKLNLPGHKHVKVYRSRHLLWGKERTLLVVFSPSFYAQQRATINRLQGQVQQHFQELASGVRRWQQTHRGPGYTQESVERKIRKWTHRNHLHEFLKLETETLKGKVVALNWFWDGESKRHIQRRYLGKTLLVTDQKHWNNETIVRAYRKLSRNENLFRISKHRRGPWWPMFHWTDSKIRVHALYCYFALLLLSILQIKLQQSAITLSVNRCIERLEKIQEAVVLYSNGAVERVLTEMEEEQIQLAKELHLFELAEKMGTTLLNQD